MKRFLSIIAFLLLLPAAGQAWGATYYVGTDGTVLAADKANATSCASASTALNLAQVNAATFSGDDIIDGCSNVYFGTSFLPPSSGSDGHPITIQNFTIGEPAGHGGV